GLRTTGSRGLTLELSTAPVGVRSLARELDRVRRRRNRQRHQYRDDQCRSPAAHGEATANASTTYRFRVFHVGYSALLASWHSTPRAQVGEAKRLTRGEVKPRSGKLAVPTKLPRIVVGLTRTVVDRPRVSPSSAAR